MMQSLLFLIVLSVVSLLVAAVDDDDTDKHWDAFKVKYDKKYDTPEEEEEARDNFEDNLLHVALHNLEDEQNYDKGLHEYSDMTPEQQVQTLCNTDPPANVSDRVLVDFSTSERQLSGYINWVERGGVSPVKNQGGCGSCWAFSAAQVIESQFIIRWNRKGCQLSPQQLVDCSSSYGNNGCNGGWPQSALRYVKEKHEGIIEEKDYPYQERDGTCNVKEKCQHYKIHEYMEVGPSGDENAVAKALEDWGPLTCAIYVSNDFMHYRSGVFCDNGYNGQGVNHGVLLVGYGTDGGQDYWLIKNSWGEGWGDKGYIKICRNHNNHLKVASYTSCPTKLSMWSTS